MTAPTPNAELMWRVLDQIDAYPELWDQGYWFTVTDCGTAACVAGWACLLSGDKPFPLLGKLEDLPVGEQVSYVDVQGWTRLARVRAQELLGITEDQADALFHYENTRDVLGRLVAEIFGPRPKAIAAAYKLDTGKAGR